MASSPLPEPPLCPSVEMGFTPVPSTCGDTSSAPSPTCPGVSPSVCSRLPGDRHQAERPPRAGPHTARSKPQPWSSVEEQQHDLGPALHCQGARCSGASCVLGHGTLPGAGNLGSDTAPRPPLRLGPCSQERAPLLPSFPQLGRHPTPKNKDPCLPVSSPPTASSPRGLLMGMRALFHFRCPDCKTPKLPDQSP